MSGANYALNVTRVGGRYDIHHVDTGSGFPVLLIHGLAGDHNAWLPQLPVLETKYRVIATDNRGAGKSTQIDEPISTEAMARDFLELMDRLGAQRFHVVGRSLGGLIGQHMALLAPDRIQSLVMLAAAAKVDPIGYRVLMNMREVLQWTDSWEAHARHSVPYFVSPKFFNENPDRIAAIERLIGGETRLKACYYRQSHAALTHDTLVRLHEIKNPVSIMAGKLDPICGPLATQWMIDRLPHAEVSWFDQSSHFFLMEEPALFMQRLTDWLAGHTQG
ncbi:MAG: alpha/beta hydrolase [Burkholderiales bacterium]